MWFNITSYGVSTLLYILSAYILPEKPVLLSTLELLYPYPTVSSVPVGVAKEALFVEQAIPSTYAHFAVCEFPSYVAVTDTMSPGTYQAALTPYLSPTPSIVPPTPISLR